MTKENLRKLLVILTIITLALPLNVAFAGSKNQNGENGAQGTDKINDKEGCRPNENAGNYWVYIPTELIPPEPSFLHEWEGGPCCPSNILSGIGENYPLPNECCNGPDHLPPEMGGGLTGEYAPGNHCLCFAYRGYPEAAIPLP